MNPETSDVILRAHCPACGTVSGFFTPQRTVERVIWALERDGASDVELEAASWLRHYVGEGYSDEEILKRAEEIHGKRQVARHAQEIRVDTAAEKFAKGLPFPCPKCYEEVRTWNHVEACEGL